MHKDFNLSELKNLILMKEGIRVVTPSDCKRIASGIRRTLNKNISETTLKRLFGFAIHKNEFSKFTIGTLYEYVHEEYDTLYGNIQSSDKEVIENSWEEVYKRATAITHSTIKTIRNRSGLPYQYTISRKFAKHDLHDFLQSSSLFTAFVAHPGHGKTISLSHLAEQFFDNDGTIPKNHALLFVKAYSLFSNEHFSLSLSEVLRAQLGISGGQNLIDLVNRQYIKNGEKMVIFLDGFSELGLKGESEKRLFECLINFISQLEDNGSIKLVLSMRTSVWTRFLSDLRRYPLLMNKWFKGANHNCSENSNVPKLTDQETAQILSRLQVEDKVIDPNLFSLLKSPQYIASYYHLGQEKPFFTDLTNLAYYELAAEFVEDKIFRSSDVTEKGLFLKRVIQLSNFGRLGYSVPKKELLQELSSFDNVYASLLSDGILIEERLDRIPYPLECVRFVHHHQFEYSMLIELLQKAKHRIDHSFFSNLQADYKDHEIGFELIKWGLRYLIKSGDFKSLPSLHKLNLTSNEKNYLLLFIAENLLYRYKSNQGTDLLIAEHGLHRFLVDEIMQLDFLDMTHMSAINLLIQTTNDNDELLLYHSLLLIHGMFRLDQGQIACTMDELLKLNTAKGREVSVIAVCLLWKMKGLEEENGRLLLNEYNNTMLAREKSGTPLQTDEFISCCLVLILNLFYQEHGCAESLAWLLMKRKPKMPLRKNPFSALMLITMAYTGAIEKPGKKTDQLQNILVEMGKRCPEAISESAEFRIKTISVMQLKRQGNYPAAYILCLECLEFFKSNGMKLNALLIYNELASLVDYLNDAGNANNFRYERLCFIEENHITRALFSLNNNAR